MSLLHVAWALWIGGTVVVLLSWVDVVGIPVGWGGFAVAIVGMILGRLPSMHTDSDDSLPPSNRPSL